MTDTEVAPLLGPFRKAFDNKAFDTTPLWPEVRGCTQANDCTHCGKCTKLLETVFR